MRESELNQAEAVKFIAQEWEKVKSQIQSQSRSHSRVKTTLKHGPVYYTDKRTSYPVSFVIPLKPFFITRNRHGVEEMYTGGTF